MFGVVQSMRIDARQRLAIGAVLVCIALAGVSASSSADDELQRFIDETKKQSGGRVEPLPEIKPYQTFAYSAAQLRSPFMPGGAGGANAASVRPDTKRNREFLEQYSLDTLKMVGTLKVGGQTYGLVQTKDGLVHRVLPGNYVGQAEGRITDITQSKINVREIVPDGLGGYIERPAALALNN
jgi:type IV pilus assembly protein PilP